MFDHRNSWRDSHEIFKRQLELNRYQLTLDPSSPQYPAHWRHFYKLMSKATSIMPVKKILDIGCGCGVYFELLRRSYPQIEYTGLDYSEWAIKMAKDSWNGNFQVKNMWDLKPKDIAEYDMVHADALLDVLPDGDDALNHLLSLKPKMMLLNRIKNSFNPSNYSVYIAYDIISTYSYHHNREKLIESISSNYTFHQECSIPPYSAFLMWGIKSTTAG